MQAAPDAVSGEIGYDRVAGLLRHFLHRARDVGDSVAYPRLRDTRVQRLARNSQQPHRGLRHIADRHGPGRIAVKSLIDDSVIKAHDISGLEFARRRDAVNDLLVYRHAKRLGINHVAGLVALEGRPRAPFEGRAFGNPVEFIRSDARAHGRDQFVEDLGNDLAGAPHDGDLFGCLDRDQWLIPGLALAGINPPSALIIRRSTSSGLPTPSIRARIPAPA